MDRRQKYNKDIKKLVLVVDDEYVNRQLLGFIIRNDYDVIYAEDGEEAMEKIIKEKDALSLVLLDLLMPKKTGFDIMKEMQEDDELKKIPVIVCTSEEDAEIKSLGMGAVDFVKKPYRNEVVLARIKRIIALAEEQNIIEATERDELTGLYNKEFFFEYATELEKYHHDWDSDAIVIGIDHFKLVNELYGRQFGDKILKSIGESIRNILSGETDGYACRYESDRFYVYCKHMDDYAAVMDEITADLSKVISHRKVRVIMGVYSDVDWNVDMKVRFDRAGLACDRMRSDHSSSIAVYDESVQEKYDHTCELLEDLRNAIDEKNVKVFYKPIYDLGSKENEPVGAEAVIRWDDKDKGLKDPKDYIPVFDENGLLPVLDHYIEEEAEAQVEIWKVKYGKVIPVSVNLTGIYHEPVTEARFSDPVSPEEFEKLFT